MYKLTTNDKNISIFEHSLETQKCPYSLLFRVILETPYESNLFEIITRN